MNAARPDNQSAEPILLTEATLEHVLDVFLPEDADVAAAAARPRSSTPRRNDDLFASEREEQSAPPADASARPWRTYATADTAGSVAVAVPRRRGKWAVAAGIAIGLGAMSGMAIQRLASRAPTATLEVSAPTTIPDAPVSPGPAARPVAAPRVASATSIRDDVQRQPATALVPAPATGSVLKGSLTPDSPESAPQESAVAAPPLDAVRTSLPMDVPIASAAVPVTSPRSEPATEPASTPVETPAAAAPSPIREPVPPARTEPHAPPAAGTNVASTTAADTASIETVLDRYRAAFKALDASAARTVWPSVDARVLNRAFDQLVEQELDFLKCAIDVQTGHATATCGGRARYVPKVGNRSVRDEARQWTFSLQKVNGQWLIERVASR